VCHEAIQKMREKGPLDIGVHELVSNNLKLLHRKGVVVSVKGL